MIKNHKERILCAAIWYRDEKKYSHQPRNIETGFVVSGHRHSNIISIIYELTGRKTKSDATQGFLTSCNRFVDRKEAAKIFLSDKEVLFSEDLY